jgi:peptidyl-prolyl cis-trans isomerase D
MLDRMRRHKSWLKWSLALVVLTFIIFYIPDFLRNPTSAGAPSGEVVATVSGHDVTAGEFQRRYQSQIQAYQGAYGATMNEQLLKQLGIDRQILQQMIDEQAALAEADRLGITVSDEEVAQQIFTIPAFQENGHFAGEQRYEQVLRSQRPPLSKSDFEENLRRSMIIDRLRTALTNWLTLPDADIQREYKQRNEKVKLQVVALTANSFRNKVTVSDADVAAHFESHKADYRIGERRKVKFLLIDQDQVRAKTTVPPSEVQRFYNENIQQYSTPEQIRASHILLKTDGKDEALVKKQAEDLVAQIKAGKDFAALAKQYSEDDASKASGGDLDYFEHGRMVPEFENVAFAMQPGQISDPVKTQYGFHIIKLVDKKPAVTRSLDEVRPEITEQLKFQKAQQTVNEEAATLGAKIKTPADLDRVGKESGFPVQESGLFTPQDPIPGLGAAPQIALTAFQMKEGQVSASLTSPRGPVFVTVTGKADPYTPTLDEVKAKVREDLIQARANDLARTTAGPLVAKLRSAKDFAAAAKAEGFEAKETGLIARDAAIPDIGVSPEVDRVAFSLPVNGVSDPISTPAGTAIVRVSERDEVTPQQFQEARDTFRNQLMNEHRGQFYSAYMTRAKEKMKISVNDVVLKRIIG